MEKEVQEKIPKRIAALEVNKKIKGQIITSIAGIVMIFLLAVTPSSCAVDTKTLKVVCSMGAFKLIVAGLGIGTMFVALVKGINEKKYIENRYSLPK